jgi:hypothetical protein
MIAELSPIEAHEKPLKHIFSDDYAFEIPPYQRPYAWELDQTRQLLDDVCEELKKEPPGTYFLGSIVLIKTRDNPISQVVDGQQRLTTLTILLSILRDLTGSSQQRMKRAELVMQAADPDVGAEQRFRLLLRREDRAFFQKNVQEPDATRNLPDPKQLKGSRQRMTENARYLRETLAKLPDTERDRLMSFLLQRCYLVVVAVPSPDSARRIFTVLNARGLDLTPTDILKADLLDRIKGDTPLADAAARWEAVENALGRDGMVELFGHIRMIYERDKPRTALETGFPAVVQPFRYGPPEDFLANVLEPIAQSVLLLMDSARVEARFGPAPARAVRSLHRIDNKDWLPPAILRLWKNKPSEYEAVGAFLIRLERLAYFLFVTRQGINDRIARFAAVMDEFDPRPGREAPANGVELTAAEQARFLADLNGAIYLKTRVCKPVLQRLDEALSSGGANYTRLVSIEHVLPQTVDAGSEWASLYPDPEQREEWTHRIANLVFLTHSINSRASNWDFERKKSEYFKSKDGISPFPLTQKILQEPDWTPARLKNRQNELIGRLAQVWNLEES